MTSEVVLTIVMALGAGLSAAVAKMWLWFIGELDDCKEDRKVLHSHVEALNTTLIGVSTTVGRLEGTFEQLKRTQTENVANIKTLTNQANNPNS
jgi:hypothetical protein